MISRFKEEFGEKEKCPSANKPTFFSRLHLAIPKRVRLTPRALDSQHDQDYFRRSPAPTSQYSSLRSTSKKTPSSRGPSFQSESQRRAADEQVAESWQRAFRAEAQQRRAGFRKSSNYQQRGSQNETGSLRKHRSPDGPSSSCLSNTSVSLGGAEATGLAPSPINSKLPYDEDKEVRPGSFDRPHRVLEEWSHQLREQEMRAEERSRAVVKPNRLKKPYKVAESWARFPSHTRSGRTGSAGPLDDVTARDFAIRSVSATGEVRWSPDKEAVEVGPSVGLRPRALTNKFGKALRTSFSKIMPGKRTVSAGVDGARNRRSSRHASGDLKFPELELPPMQGGYKELRAFERELDYLKGGESLHDRGSSHDVASRADNAGSKPSTASVIHLDGSSVNGDETLKIDEPQQLRSTSRMSAPVTPAPQRGARTTGHTQESTSTGVDHWETPPSRMSFYDDAVLHRKRKSRCADRDTDFDSVKSDSTVVRKSRSRTVPNLATVGSGPAKFKTWSGRAKTQPVLMESTLEFGAELERMLHRERERARGLGCAFDAAGGLPKDEPVAA